jgi:hypothetical protein
MKIPVIKKLVESYSYQQLQAAENAILNEEVPEIEIEGEDEGEKLTHTLAAIFILDHIKELGGDFSTALREYTKKVRASIN